MTETATLTRRPRRGVKVVRPETTTVRCAIYTRKSTEEGLDSDFNTLDAQREAGESYIASQCSEGWTCLPDRYDDGGFTGGDMERPALQRLLDDIRAGKVDCVVVYKVDRLSRSLMDFARIVEVFEKHGVSFVSVTQQFNTSTSMGRLMLNVLFSFAQFEREIIGERTRDKMAAARKKGKWIGGQPVLGYDIDREAKKLVVNKNEASLVRTIFSLYLKLQSILAVLKELKRRGALTKRWETKKGTTRGGRPFSKPTVRSLLSNVLYLGRVEYQGEVYEGEHEAIIDEETFNRVQEIKRHNSATYGAHVRNKHGGILKGVLRCAACDAAMTHATSKRGPKRYRYYVCTGAQKHGWDSCPNKSIPAQEIEDFVLERIRDVGRDPGVIGETIRQVAGLKTERRPELEAEHRRLASRIERLNREGKELVSALGNGNGNGTIVAARLGEIEEGIAASERRATEVREQLIAIERETVDEKSLTAALSHFDGVWEALYPRERSRVISLLIERIEWSREDEMLEITFRPNGIKALAAEAFLAAKEKPE